ncbi:hypothetical protein QM415_05765 [Streptococcus peroris]|jgi:hypothetical protein|uniref:hypothetical protein n=1 Tax=Streptococcus peroris TaxID=68891 RepID=UPI0021E00856|nr:hypothetical protein [Streptococcus sp. Marseille-Q6470]
MITNLKQTLRKLYAYRLINYGNTAYQHITNDWHFENVPTQLKELWHGQDVVSFITLSIAYDSDIDFMSHHELVRRIDNEYYLIARLEKIFSDLRRRK